MSDSQSLWSHGEGEGGLVLKSDAQSLWSHSEGEWGVVLTSETASLSGLTVSVRREGS